MARAVLYRTRQIFRPIYLVVHPVRNRKCMVINELAPKSSTMYTKRKTYLSNVTKILICLYAIQVCNMVLNKPGSTIERHPEHMAPYGYIGETWVAYDDVESLSLKVYGFMLKHCLFP